MMSRHEKIETAKASKKVIGLTKEYQTDMAGAMDKVPRVTATKLRRLEQDGVQRRRHERRNDRKQTS